MAKRMYIQLAPIRLKDGLHEKTLLEASDAFQVSFVSNQAGIMKRMLLKGKDGSYADLVFFESKDDADRVARLEETSQECFEFFKIMEAPDKSLPDMGVLSFEHMKTYE
ncbi:MAG: hypothetical protein L0210_01925 [Rhodospirillales bacterium]|nr:hypothetical protein [Rhodospirillales bacterium]